MEPKKTTYCEYSEECDREEDCFNGRFCAFFKYRKAFSSEDPEEEDTTGEDALSDILDGVWSGEKEVRR